MEGRRPAAATLNHRPGDHTRPGYRAQLRVPMASQAQAGSGHGGAVRACAWSITGQAQSQAAKQTPRRENREICERGSRGAGVRFTVLAITCGQARARARRPGTRAASLHGRLARTAMARGWPSQGGSWPRLAEPTLPPCSGRAPGRVALPVLPVVPSHLTAVLRSRRAATAVLRKLGRHCANSRLAHLTYCASVS